MLLYRLFGPKKELLWVGKTVEDNIETEIKKQYSFNFNVSFERATWFFQSCFYDYAEVENKTDIEIYRIYYINRKGGSKYNKKFNYRKEVTFELPELQISQLKKISEIIDFEKYFNEYMQQKQFLEEQNIGIMYKN